MLRMLFKYHSKYTVKLKIRYRMELSDRLAFGLATANDIQLCRIEQFRMSDRIE